MRGFSDGCAMAGEERQPDKGGEEIAASKEGSSEGAEEDAAGRVGSETGEGIEGAPRERVHGDMTQPDGIYGDRCGQVGEGGSALWECLCPTCLSLLSTGSANLLR